MGVRSRQWLNGTVPGVEAIREELARILESPQFAGSQRLCRFLRYVVEKSLAGDAEGLKEFAIALEVFDRKADYDPSIDSIVRVEARRLRLKLKEYYEKHGARDGVAIQLKAGSYAPEFVERTRESAPRPVVAVLPFVNMSAEPEQDYFCDGITEEILNVLARIPEIAVVARTSAFQFKGQAIDIREVGARLGAQIVVEGSVRKVGSRVRITAQTIDAEKGIHLWSETYQRELEDVFAIQDEISEAIARGMRGQAPAPRGMDAKRPSLAAYTAYHRALNLINSQTVPGMREGIAELQELIRQEADYAEPYAGVAMALGALALFGVEPGRAVEREMRWHAEEAVRLNPESADGWVAMAGLSAHWDFDWKESERRFRRAIALQPSNFSARSWFGMVLTMMGRFAEAEEELMAAMRVNPLVAPGYARLGFLAYVRGDEEEAMAQAEEALRMDARSPDARLVLAMVLLKQGEAGKASEVLAEGVKEFPIPMHLGMLAGALHRAGKRKDAKEILARLEAMGEAAYVTPMAYVAAYTGMEDIERALEAVRKSVQDRGVFADMMNVDPYFEGLWGEERFRKLVREMNLERR